MDTEPDIPSPAQLFEDFQAFHRSHALRTALELDIFTCIDAGASSVDEIAAKWQETHR